MSEVKLEDGDQRRSFTEQHIMVVVLNVSKGVLNVTSYIFGEQYMYFLRVKTTAHLTIVAMRHILLMSN